MKFLVDNQLPPALARHLESHGHEAKHVSEIGLAEATDQAIWQAATEQGRVIVSKDEDFLHMTATTDAGPGVVWVRLGNCRKSALLSAFDGALPDIVEQLSKGQRIVELR
ncbi:MAG: DUF5615 family PIN-like protein [Planctomycetia bacterium]|nr:DUF5615 family PIN-like protein [Planctomycetia bacterium]